MRQDFKKKLDKLFIWIYYLLIGSILLLAGLFLGLFIFSLIPAIAAVFKVFEQVMEESKRNRLKVFKFWFENLRENFKKFYVDSIILSVIFGISYTNLLFFSSSNSVIGSGVYYITLIILALLPFFVLFVAHIAAFYNKLNLRQRWKNAISLLVVNLLDIIMLAIFLVIIGLLLEKMCTILLIFVAPGLLILLVKICYDNILKGKSTYGFFIKRKY